MQRDGKLSTYFMQFAQMICKQRGSQFKIMKFYYNVSLKDVFF